MAHQLGAPVLARRRVALLEVDALGAHVLARLLAVGAVRLDVHDPVGHAKSLTGGAGVPGGLSRLALLRRVGVGGAVAGRPVAAALLLASAAGARRLLLGIALADVAIVAHVL